MSQFTNAAILLALATTSRAQYGSYGGNGGGGNPYTNGNGDGSDNGPGSSTYPGISGFDRSSFFSSQHMMVLSHAVLACIAFGFMFPVGGIMIRLGSFPGLWIVHGLFQVVGYILYIAAFAIGIYMAVNLHLMDEAHVIIGIILFVLLFFQPLSGFIHHVAFRKSGRRTMPSFAHIWLGRLIVTAGIVDGGLGLELASRLPFARPNTRAIIAYSVAAGVIWLLYVASIVIGERRRSQAVAAAASSSSGSTASSRPRSKKSSQRNEKIQYA